MPDVVPRSMFMVRGAMAALVAMASFAAPRPRSTLLNPVDQLPEGYDPTVIRSGPASRPNQRTAHKGLNVCACGFRTRRLVRMQAHRCSA